MNDFETVVERHPPALPGAADRAAAGPGDRRAAAPGPQAPAGPQFPGPAGQAGLRGPVVLGKGIEPRSSARTWTVELPPMPLVNSNQRIHYMARYRLMKTIRDAATWTARAEKIPHLEYARIVGELRFPDRRKRDPANWADSAKAGVDGLVSAGVLPDDDWAHLIGPDMRLGEPDRTLSARGLPGTARLILHITELEGTPE